MKKLIPLIVLLAVHLVVAAQKQGNIWYFGKHAGLDFNSGAPVPLTDGQTKSPDITTPESSSSICDSLGSLLFYTDGQKVWNKNQQVMPNGDSLLGSFSSTQGALIVAQPGSSRYFYIFTTDAFYKDNLKYGFRYSIVDICMNNDSGDIIAGQKNILLLDTVCEKLTAVRHANGVDYWIIVHKFHSDAFYSYHLSSLGIIDTVVTHIGSFHPNPADTYQGSASAIGQMKASPNGKKLAIVNGGNDYTVAEYFDFDDSTGVVSNWVNLQTNATLLDSYYGVSFSPDNTKLYIAADLNANGIFQFDLNAGGGDSISVRASKMQVANTTYNFFALQLAPNGKIYITRSPNIGIPALDVINFPDSLGLSCGYQSAAVYLNGDSAGEGLPNFIPGFDYSNTTYSCTKTSINEIADDNVTVFPNPSVNGWQLSVSSDLIGSSIEITDADGRIVSKSEIQDIHSEIKLNVVPGIYLMRINSSKNSILKKLVKL